MTEELCQFGATYLTNKVKYYELIACSSQRPQKSTVLDRKAFNRISEALSKHGQDRQDGVHGESVKYQNYELVQDSGKTQLFDKKRDRIVLILEDSFDVLYSYHLSNNHANKEQMINFLKNNYVFTIIYVEYMLMACDVCSAYTDVLEVTCEEESANETLPKSKSFQTFQLDTYEPRQPDGRFKFVLLCQDLHTSFLFLRPLVSESAVEIATELLKIITSFMSPEYVIVNSPSKKLLFGKAIKVLEDFGLNTKITVDCRPESMSMNSLRILKCLVDWMKITGTSSWGLGCHIVQWRYNNQKYPEKNKALDRISLRETPYLSVFGKSSSGYDDKNAHNVSNTNDSDVEIDDDVCFSEAD